MTKTKLLLVSLLLVFGLTATVPTASAVGTAGTQWTIFFNGQTEVRHEGHAETLGAFTFSYQNLTGFTSYIATGSTLKIVYGAPIAWATPGHIWAVSLTCGGYDPSPDLCPNIGIGVVNTATTGTVTLTFADETFASGQPTTLITLVVRADATTVPYCNTISASITASHAGSTALTIASNESPYVVATEKCGTAVTVSLRETADVLTCIGVHDVDYYDNDFGIRLVENDNEALTSLSDEILLETNGSIPTNGSNIMIILTGVPPLVGVKPRPPRVCENFHSGDPNYCSGGVLAISDGVAVAGTPAGTMEWVYTVIATDPLAIDAADFSFKFWSKGPLPPNQGYQIQVQVRIVDGNPPQTTWGPDVPWFDPSQYESDGATPPAYIWTVVTFNDCVTNLLFPYINTVNNAGTAFAHFGTGIDIANTTWDPFGLNPATARGSAVPQNGNCTLYLYPFDSSATVVYPTPTINAGGSWAFDVATQAPAFAGKYGYGIAICGFQNAYGFAEIYDNYGVADPTATLSYLAYILPDPAFYRRSPAGDGLGEESIAPINLSRRLQKGLWLGH